MNPTADPTALQLRSLVTQQGELELSLVEVPTPDPGPNEVLLRVEAAPLNPSDLGLLFGGADMSTARASGTLERPVVKADVPKAAMKGIAGRLDQSLAVGNEGAGVVVKTGSSDAARALMGRTVAALGGAMYSQYRCVPVELCLALLPGTTAAQGASSFVNPLTALGMVETMRREGHRALVHTAAASNLGKMLVRLCAKDQIELVNIVRKPAQLEELRSMGATHVCDSSQASFMDDLTDALVATGATLAFDAIGGGRLAGQILTCMESALNRTAQTYSRYGSSTHKQVYLYGGLDTGPTEFNRSFGMAWGMGGWLVFPYLQKIGVAANQALRERVAAELTTTFSSEYSKEISLIEALQLETMQAYGQRATGQKFLINPNK